MTKITCITTTFNEDQALMISVNSILAQSFTDFQYIIVDDGSSESTRNILDGLDDPRIMVIKQANDGLSGARNRALEQATGDYVCFLDADDSRPNWSFSAINDIIERDDPDLILCPGVLQDLRGEATSFYDARVFDLIARECPSGTTQRGNQDYAKVRALAQRIEPQSANKVVRRSFLKKTGIGFPNTHFFEDIFFHTGVIVAADRISFAKTPTFAYFRRYMRPQLTATAGDMRFDIIAVSKLTLEAFSRKTEFHDTTHRAAVLASCMKIVQWCENTVSHHHRYAFKQCARVMLRMIDPLYLHLPANLSEEVGDLSSLRTYLSHLK
ncbi:glycosyltransferase [bacterium]|nr:glycosyltransferase [bacterium]